MADTTEPEMVMRLADSVRHAADYVSQACRNIASGRRSDPIIVVRLRECLNHASGSATQLAHARDNPAFLALRDSLTAVSSTVMMGGLGDGPKHGIVLANVGRVLEALHYQALKLLDARPMPRQQALEALDRRQAAIMVH